MTSRKRVVQVLYSGLGGHTAVALTLINAHGADDPWDHHIVFYGIEQVAPGYGEICAQLGIPYSYIQAREGRPWAAWPDLVRALKKIRPDAVILHSIKTIAAARFAFRNGPLIAVEHQPNALKTRPEWFASAMSQHLANHVVMLSSDYDQTVRSRLGPFYSSRRTTIIPTGIDLTAFSQRRAWKAEKKSIRIGMAARFSSSKAQDTLVDAIMCLTRTYPDTDWKLSLPGDGVRLSEVARVVTTKGLQNQIELPGYLSPNQLLNWFEKLDIYAHSSDGETLSTALLQAIAAGLPVIASDVSGISDLLGAPALGEEPIGHLVPARDPDAFARAIAEDLANPIQTSKRISRARKHILCKHSPKVMRERYALLLGETS